MVKHFCNCCEKSLDGKNWVRIEYTLTDVNTEKDMIHEGSKHYSDLCPECYQKCIKILNGGNEND